MTIRQGAAAAARQARDAGGVIRHIDARCQQGSRTVSALFAGLGLELT
jgi:hypothetical protein